MNTEKLRKMQEQVRTGGKGSVRRKHKAAIKTSVSDINHSYVDVLFCRLELLFSIRNKRRKRFFFFFFFFFCAQSSTFFFFFFFCFNASFDLY
jgi:hypothetical protein